MKLLKVLRRIVFRQKYRAHIRREQEEFLQQHPELRLPDPEARRAELLAFAAELARLNPDAEVRFGGDVVEPPSDPKEKP